MKFPNDVGKILNFGLFSSLRINLKFKIYFSQLGSIIRAKFTLRAVT
jgi:hypothetical protein